MRNGTDGACKSSRRLLRQIVSNPCNNTSLVKRGLEMRRGMVDCIRWIDTVVGTLQNKGWHDDIRLLG